MIYFWEFMAQRGPPLLSWVVRWQPIGFTRPVHS